jgi:hypothetical protein
MIGIGDVTITANKGGAPGPEAAPDPLEYAARMMWEAGWQRSGDTPLTKWDARDATDDTYIALIRLGALVRDWRKLRDPERPTRDGAAFARAALRTWPRIRQLPQSPSTRIIPNGRWRLSHPTNPPGPVAALS